MKQVKLSLQAVEPVIDKIESLSKVQRILIYCGTLILLIGAFTYFYYLPKLQTLDKLSKEYNQIEKQLTVAKKKAATLERFKAEMKKAEVQFKIVMKKLPEKQEIPSLLASISQSGQDAGLEFVLFQPKPEISKDFYAEIPVAVNVNGGYHNVAIFFDKVARLSRIVNINDIKLAAPHGSEDLSASCTTVTYKFVETAPQAKKTS